MSKGSPSPPPAPDPAKLAAAQGAANKETAVAQANLNRVDQSSPFGSQTYTRPDNYWVTDPKTGKRSFNDNADPWKLTTTLAPAEQANLDRTRALTGSTLDLGQTQLGNISNTVSKPLDYSSAPQVQNLNFGGLPGVRGADFGSLGGVQGLDYSKLGEIPGLSYSNAPAAPNAAAFQGPNSDTTNALYSAYTSRLDPQWQRERESVESRLQAQGVNVQSNPEAYSRALSDYNKSRTDAYQQALAGAVGVGVAENSNAFNRSLAGRQQGVTEANQMYGAGLGNRQQLTSEADRQYAAGMGNRQQLGSEMAQQQSADLQRRQQMAAEQGQQYNASLGNRQQALQEITAQRNQPINELAALLGTSGGVNSPQFGGVPGVNVQAPDIMGANSMATNQANNIYSQQMASNNAKLGAAGTLAGVGLQTAFPSSKFAGAR